jgi:hypothetical protein
MWAAAKHTTSGSDSLFGPAKTALARGDHMVVDQHQPRCQSVSRSFITVDHQYQAALAPEPAVIGAARRHIGPLPASSGTQPGAPWRQELRKGTWPQPRRNWPGGGRSRTPGRTINTLTVLGPAGNPRARHTDRAARALLAPRASARARTPRAPGDPARRQTHQCATARRHKAENSPLRRCRQCATGSISGSRERMDLPEERALRTHIAMPGSEYVCSVS